MSDIWADFGKRSKDAVQAANDLTGGLIPLALAAALGGTLADIAIRASKARFKSPWAASVVIFAIAWALLKFLPREGVRLIVAGMFGRLGPESYSSVIKPLGQKFGVHVELDPHAAPAKPLALPGGTDSKDAGHPPTPAAKDGAPAKSGTKPANCSRAANDEGWMPPAADIRPIAQGVLENRQNLYDLTDRRLQEPSAPRRQEEAHRPACARVVQTSG